MINHQHITICKQKVQDYNQTTNKTPAMFAVSGSETNWDNHNDDDGDEDESQKKEEKNKQTTKKNSLPFCTTEEEKVLYPPTRLAENTLMHLFLWKQSRVGVRGQHVWSVWLSRWIYINSMKQTTLIHCSPKQPPVCKIKEKNPPRPGMSLGSTHE